MGHEHNHSCGAAQTPISIGSIWFIGWLFTIGFAELSFWKAVLALVLWPYFLGAGLA
jgi:hypothetical protein